MLHKIQKDFVALISGNDTQDTAFLADGGVRVSDRLSIYRDNVHAGLHNILCTAYPIVRRIVGDEFMALMTQRYIAANKPVNADMNQYGNSFADFIAHFSPAAELPYLPDMARFEWAQHCAYFAPDEDMCDPDALAALPEEAQNSLQLELKSCVYLIQSVWPLTHICDFAQAQNDSLTLDISTEI
ncbi:MAG: DNA-binding domain-containing protein, partial [Alphaproteobacteria bacterium]|nr:DNA-binding domain-containing protein [Alphaproteobacteria bacterium]